MLVSPLVLLLQQLAQQDKVITYLDETTLTLSIKLESLEENERKLILSDKSFQLCKYHIDFSEISP